SGRATPCPGARRSSVPRARPPLPRTWPWRVPTGPAAARSAVWPCRPRSPHRIPSWPPGVLQWSSPSKVSRCSLGSSSFPPAIAGLLAGRQGTGVDDKDRVIRVKHEDDLQESSPPSPSHDEELVFADLLRERRAGLPNHHFRFLPIHTML